MAGPNDNEFPYYFIVEGTGILCT